MTLDEINALYELSAHKDRDDIIPSLRRFETFKMHAAGAWPAIYRELKAGRAVFDARENDPDMMGDAGILLDVYIAARKETDQ